MGNVLDNQTFLVEQYFQSHSIQLVDALIGGHLDGIWYPFADSQHKALQILKNIMLKKINP